MIFTLASLLGACLAQNGNMLHITDVHLDVNYVAGSSVKNYCHGSASLRQKRSKDELAGRFGSVDTKCDSPLELVQNTFGFIKQLHAKSPFDFVIWTGDAARHDRDDSLPRSWEEVKDMEVQALSFILDTFPLKDGKPLITFLPSIGNLDVNPNSQLAYTPGQVNPVLDFYADLWKAFIPNDQVETFKNIGSFYIELAPGLWGISLNTIYFMNTNNLVVSCSKSGSAASAVMVWLETVLDKAVSTNVKVYLTGHVPPSDLEFFKKCYKPFSALLAKHSTVITGQFYGHANLDHFYFPLPTFDPVNSLVKRKSSSKLLDYFNDLVNNYEESSKSTDALPYPIMVSPSVIPAYNPSLRVLKYAPGGRLIGYDQYYCDLAKWNAVQGPIDASVFYELEYSTTDYQMADLSIQGWLDLANRAKTSQVSGDDLRNTLTQHMVVNVLEALES